VPSPCQTTPPRPPRTRCCLGSGDPSPRFRHPTASLCTTSSVRSATAVPRDAGEGLLHGGAVATPSGSGIAGWTAGWRDEGWRRSLLSAVFSAPHDAGVGRAAAECHLFKVAERLCPADSVPFSTLAPSTTSILHLRGVGTLSHRAFPLGPCIPATPYQPVSAPVKPYPSLNGPLRASHRPPPVPRIPVMLGPHGGTGGRLDSVQIRR